MEHSSEINIWLHSYNIVGMNYVRYDSQII